MRGINNRWGHADAGARWGTSCDMAASSHFGCGHCHNRRGNVAVPPTGRITACGVHWDRFLPSNETRNNLHFHVRNRGLLRLGKPFHIVMGELDISLELVRHLRAGRFDLFRSQKHVALVFVELGRIFQRFGVATLLNLVKNVLHDLMSLRRIRLGGQRCFFQIVTGHLDWILLIDFRQQAG